MRLDALCLLLVAVSLLPLASISMSTSTLATAPNTSPTCDDISHCRALSRVFLGCLSTIFLYTYVSMHLTVPAPRHSLLPWFKRTGKMMSLALLVPEVFVGFAFRQYRAAWRYKRSGRIDASITEGYFFAMGGFVDKRDGHPIVELQEMEDYEMPNVTLPHDADTLAARQTADAGWLTAILSIPSRVWRWMGCGADREATTKTIESVAVAAEIQDKSKKNVFAKTVALLQGFWFIIQCLLRLAQRLPLTQLEVITIAYGATNVAVWWYWRRKPIGVSRPIGLPLAVDAGKNEKPPLYDRPQRELHDRVLDTFLGVYPLYEPTDPKKTCVPEFWASGATPRDYVLAFFVECIVGFLFGVIHLAAWNAEFLSVTEGWIWRAASIAASAVPVVAAAFLPLLPGKWLFFHPKLFFWIACAPLLFLYTASRLLLVGIAFAAFRALPVGTLEQVSWSVYFPHIS